MDSEVIRESLLPPDCNLEPIPVLRASTKDQALGLTRTPRRHLLINVVASGAVMEDIDHLPN